MGRCGLAAARGLGRPQGCGTAVRCTVALRSRYHCQYRPAGPRSPVKIHGEDHERTIRAASNYVGSLINLRRFEEAKSLIRRTIPVARRVLGKCDILTLKMRWADARVLWGDDDATLDDLREAVTRLEDVEPTARRVFGSAHPLTEGIEDELRDARAALRARKTPPAPGS